MSLQLCGYVFPGPFDNTRSLVDRSGVYVIVDKRYDGYHVIDVGESHAVKARIENHERKSCWSSNSLGTLAVFVLYTPNLQQTGRISIEKMIRQAYSPPCGER